MDFLQRLAFFHEDCFSASAEGNETLSADVTAALDPDFQELLPKLQKIYKKYGVRGYKINRRV